MYQLIYSLDNANSTFSGIDELVRFWAAGPDWELPVRSVWSEQGLQSHPSQPSSKGLHMPLGAVIGSARSKQEGWQEWVLGGWGSHGI